MEIRAYKNGDEKEIMELDARELPSVWNRRTIENWHWKFTGKNPAGHSYIWVAENNGTLVGHFAAVPYMLKVFDQEVKASHTIGALVDKKYRNRGLLKFVSDKLMEELARNNIPYTWGFPNKLAHRFENVALGYNDLILFDRWQLDKSKFKTRPAIHDVRKITQFDEQFDHLWETCAPDYPIAIIRKHPYLNWRYLQRPDWEYTCFALYENRTLKGYIVLKLYREEYILRGHIIDIFAQKDDEPTFTHLLDTAFNYFIEHEVDEITVLFWGNPLIEMLFIEYGFQRIHAEIPLILRINMENKYDSQVKDKSHWYFTMGDSTEVY